MYYATTQMPNASKKNPDFGSGQSPRGEAGLARRCLLATSASGISQFCDCGMPLSASYFIRILERNIVLHVGETTFGLGGLGLVTFGVFLSPEHLHFFRDDFGRVTGLPILFVFVGL